MSELEKLFQNTRSHPYWWDRAPLAPVAAAPAALPAEIDVLVIGSGFTGLSAALQLARAGRSVLVLEAHRLGEGASTRNGGIITDQLKPSLAELQASYGQALAYELLREAKESLIFLKAFVKAEGIDCGIEETGRFRGALAQSQYDAMRRGYEAIDKAVGMNFEPVDQAAVSAEVGTERYVGGVVLPDLFSLDPGKYHLGLLKLVREAGVVLQDNTPAVGLRRSGSKTIVRTPRGKITARDVLVATNGYTPKAAQWLRRRVIPVKSYMNATDRLPGDVVKSVMPRKRTVVDTNNLLVYYRVSPEGDRILFGGRPHYTDVDPVRGGIKLRNYLVELFPALAGVPITHAWNGSIAYSFDRLPHLGKTAAYHYAAGYCGAGVAMSTWLGRKAALRIAGDLQGRTAFAEIKHPGHFAYGGKPWFLPIVQAWYQGLDFLGR